MVSSSSRTLGLTLHPKESEPLTISGWVNPMELETDAADTATIGDTMMALTSLDVNGDFKTGTTTLGE